MVRLGLLVALGRVVGARLGCVRYAFATVDLNRDVEFKVDRGCVGDEVGAVGFRRLYQILAGLVLDWITSRLSKEIKSLFYNLIKLVSEISILIKSLI